MTRFMEKQDDGSFIWWPQNSFEMLAAHEQICTACAKDKPNCEPCDLCPIVGSVYDWSILEESEPLGWRVKDRKAYCTEFEPAKVAA